MQIIQKDTRLPRNDSNVYQQIQSLLSCQLDDRAIKVGPEGFEPICVSNVPVLQTGLTPPSLAQSQLFLRARSESNQSQIVLQTIASPKSLVPIYCNSYGIRIRTPGF